MSQVQIKQMEDALFAARKAIASLPFIEQCIVHTEPWSNASLVLKLKTGKLFLLSLEEVKHDN